MPQGNLETLVSACAGGSHDNKIVCETLATTESDSDDHLHLVEKPEEEEIAPESFWLSKDAEFDWFDRNAFYERKESHKGNSTNLNPSLNSNSNSQRFSLRKSKAFIIGLPKPQKPCFVEPKNRKHTKPGSTRLFPKRSGSAKSDRPVVEPSSPKVSCIGRVRSKRDRKGRVKKREQNPAGVQTVKEKATQKRSSLFSSFRSIFRPKSNGKTSEAHAPAVGNKDIRSRLQRHDDEAEAIWIEPEIMESEVVVEPLTVSLGGMKRFASGRRSEPLI